MPKYFWIKVARSSSIVDTSSTAFSSDLPDIRTRRINATVLLVAGGRLLVAGYWWLVSAPCRLPPGFSLVRHRVHNVIHSDANS